MGGVGGEAGGAGGGRRASAFEQRIAKQPLNSVLKI